MHETEVYDFELWLRSTSNQWGHLVNRIKTKFVVSKQNDDRGCHLCSPSTAHFATLRESVKQQRMSLMKSVYGSLRYYT